MFRTDIIKEFLKYRPKFDLREMSFMEQVAFGAEWDLIQRKESKLPSALRKRITKIMRS